MAVSDAHVFPGFLTPVLTQLFFLKPLFSHASAEVRGENTLERKFTSTGNGTHNHQVMSQTIETNFGLFQTERVESSPKGRKHWEKEELPFMSNFSFFHIVFKRLTVHSLKQRLVWERVNS